MQQRTCALALGIFLLLGKQPVDAARIDAAPHAAREAAGKAKNLCGDKMLKLTWDDGKGTKGEFRLDYWENAELFRKTQAASWRRSAPGSAPGARVQVPACEKVYTGVCARGGFEVKGCDENDFRGLTGIGAMFGRDSDVNHGETVTLVAGDKTIVLHSGKVEFVLVDIADHPTYFYGEQVTTGKCGQDPMTTHIQFSAHIGQAYEAVTSITMAPDFAANQYTQCVSVSNGKDCDEEVSACPAEFPVSKMCAKKYSRLICCRKCACDEDDRRSWPCKPVA